MNDYLYLDNFFTFSWLAALELIINQRKYILRKRTVQIKLIFMAYLKNWNDAQSKVQRNCNEVFKIETWTYQFNIPWQQLLNNFY